MRHSKCQHHKRISKDFIHDAIVAIAPSTHNLGSRLCTKLAASRPRVAIGPSVLEFQVGRYAPGEVLLLGACGGRFNDA